jgi:hypothetical protein
MEPVVMPRAPSADDVLSRGNPRLAGAKRYDRRLNRDGELEVDR